MIKRIDGPVGAPWERPLHGTLDRLSVESDALASNPLGDPSVRPLYVYRPPGVELDHPKALPSVYVIQGYTGQLDMWFGRQPFEPTMIERLGLDHEPVERPVQGPLPRRAGRAVDALDHATGSGSGAKNGSET